MISSGARSFSASSRSLGQAVFRSFEDVERQPLVERQRLALLDERLDLLFAEVGGECGDRIVAAPPDQILGEAPLFLGDRDVALQLLGVDDRKIESGLHAVIEHHRVQHLAPRFRQSEGNVGHAEDRLAARQRCLDQPDAFDRFDGRADVVAIAGADRKDQRVEDDVLGLDAVLLRSVA